MRCLGRILKLSLPKPFLFPPERRLSYPVSQIVDQLWEPDDPAMGSICIVCGSMQWVRLVPPHPTRSVRIDGVVEESPLRKLHCRQCGLGYRPPTRELSKLYGEEYDLYGNRPGAEAFNQSRHPTVTHLIAALIGDVRPTRILEIGCGDGGTLTAMRRKWPRAELCGVEPSGKATRMAREAGHEVVEGFVEEGLPDETVGQFDLILSYHVIEHTLDPVRFLTALADRLTPDGIVVTVCPNGAVPHAELIHSDHLFSFTPEHLVAVARKAHLAPGKSRAFILEDAHEFNQILVAGRGAGTGWYLPAGYPAQRWPNPSQLEHDRNKYLRGWTRLDAELSCRVRHSTGLVCFGTGGWAARLAGYAPGLWDQVRACTVDGPRADRFSGKPVLEYATLGRHQPDAVIAGVNPSRQESLAARLQGDGFRVIQWNDLIEC